MLNLPSGVEERIAFRASRVGVVALVKVNVLF